MSQKHTTVQQFSTLVDFLKENEGIAKGFLNAPQYKAMTAQLWDGITKVLNSLGPPMKTKDGWKKVWKDFKYHIKSKLRHNDKCFHGTGGGPNKKYIFSATKEEIISLLDLRKQVCGLKVLKFGAAEKILDEESQKEIPVNIDQTHEICVSPDTMELLEQSHFLLGPNQDENENPSWTEDQGQEEFVVDQEEDVLGREEDIDVQEKTPTRQTRTSTATAKKLLELQIKNQDLFHKKTVELLQEQNVLLKEQNYEFKEQSYELRKIRKLKEEKVKVLKRNHHMMEKESIENRKLKILELEIKKKKLVLQEMRCSVNTL